MNGRPPLTFSSAGVMMQIWRQRIYPLPPNQFFYPFYFTFQCLHKIGDIPICDNRDLPIKILQTHSGLCPEPRGLTLWFPRGRKKDSILSVCCPSQTRYDAHVAPQRCTILHIGKASTVYHRFKKIFTLKIKIVLDMGYTS